MTGFGEFTCTQCGETFNKGQSDESAMTEARDNFGQPLQQSDMDVLCDDCYNKFMSWYESNSKAN